jgi:hypothetical protein
MVRNQIHSISPRYLLMTLPKTDTMEILEEKANGGPSMDIVDDVVSVRDRTLFHLHLLSALISDISLQTMLLPQSTCQT